MATAALAKEFDVDIAIFGACNLYNTNLRIGGWVDDLCRIHEVRQDGRLDGQQFKVQRRQNVLSCEANLNQVF